MPLLIPEEFILGHDLAFGLHDLLVEHVVLGERNKLQYFSMQFKRPEDAESLEGIEQGEAFWHWCENHGYRDVLDEHTFRSLAFALLSDMCHFLYEALKCSEKAKLAVAFCDLRKPLQDNLFYLEWMLADRADFLSRFQAGPEQIDTSKLREARKERRLQIIGQAMDHTAKGRWVDPEWLYELRYEKDSEFSLDRYFNHAVHLVTTHKQYATSAANMNFIFVNDDDRQEMWRYLYLTLPMVLMHSLFIVRAIFQTFAPDFKPRNAFTDLWLLCGLLLSAHELGVDRQRATAASLFKEVLTDISLDCRRCNASVELNDASMQRFWNHGDIRCPSCRYAHRLVDPSHVQIYDTHPTVGDRTMWFIAKFWPWHASS